MVKGDDDGSDSCRKTVEEKLVKEKSSKTDDDGVERCHKNHGWRRDNVDQVLRRWISLVSGERDPLWYVGAADEALADDRIAVDVDKDVGVEDGYIRVALGKVKRFKKHKFLRYEIDKKLYRDDLAYFLEGRLKEGCLHGPVRIFGQEVRMRMKRMMMRMMMMIDGDDDDDDDDDDR